MPSAAGRRAQRGVPPDILNPLFAEASVLPPTAGLPSNPAFSSLASDGDGAGEAGCAGGLWVAPSEELGGRAGPAGEGRRSRRGGGSAAARAGLARAARRYAPPAARRGAEERPAHRRLPWLCPSGLRRMADRSRPGPAGGRFAVTAARNMGPAGGQRGWLRAARARLR